MLTADVHSEDDSAAEGLKEMDNITALHGDGSAQRQREEVEKALSVPDETTRCLGIECSIDIAKRSTYSDRKKVILAGVLPQLRAVLEKELPQILQHRRYHHENARSTETGYEFSESFAKNCETNREFAANIIRLSAIITADGFRYDGKGVKRAQVWPMTLALLDITAAKRFSLKNILTVGLFRGNEKPTLEDLAATNKLRPKLRVQNGILEEVEKIGGRVKLPTYCSARLISLTAVANCSAKELLMASHLILPILCFEMYINDGLTASYTLALSCLIRALYMDGLKKDDLNDIAYALEALGSLWDEVYSKGTTTIKTHSFFAHLPEQLRKYGNVVDLDTSGFEHSYMEYKHLLNPHVTTNFDLYALQRARGLRPEDTADPFVPEQRVNPPNTTSPAYPSYDALLRYVPFGNSVTL
ncbi:unnamed protein product [Caenorhabditis auriculariae]|uniref:Uncharacterized protein n=1 Tax=Caenorhabditis auriculariae TaxID=2777116 RepID=A0A8S1HXA9_9PELO|nr:unnamed protein product [Caenorhabditis auriculariae]